MELNYGIMSVSSIAPRFIAALRESDSGCVVAVSSRSLERAKQKAEEWNIPKAYGSHAELLDDKDVNIVYISSVNSAHYSMAKAALEKGKNVVCEKPCTVSEKETEELYALARKKGLFFMEAQKMLFLPVINEVKSLIDRGEIGDIVMITMSHSFSAAYNNWMYDEALGGGPLLSSGIYAIQLMQYLLGDIDDIDGKKTAVENGVESQYCLTGRLKNGTLFCVNNSTLVALDNRAVIYGKEGRIELPEYWKTRKALVYRGDSPERTIEYPCKYEMIYEAEHIKRCMEEGRITSPVVTEEISLKGIKAIEMVKKKW